MKIETQKSKNPFRKNIQIKNLMFTLLQLLVVNLSHAQNNEKKALVVIDIQKNIVDPNSAMHMDPVEIDQYIQHVNKTIQTFKNNGSPIIYTINEFTNPFMNLVTKNVCKKGTAGTEIDPRINIESGMIYHKSKGSAFSNKELADFLSANKITEIYVVGMFAENCVKATVKDGVKKHYKVTVIEKAIGSRNSKKKKRSVSLFKRKGATVI